MTRELNESDLLEELASRGWTRGLTELSPELEQQILEIMRPVSSRPAEPAFLSCIGRALSVYAEAVVARHKSRGPGGRRRKLSTVLAGKLKAIRPCVESSLSALEPLAFQRDLVPSDLQPTSFLQAWRLADDGVALLERFAAPADILPTPIDLAPFLQEWAALNKALGALSVPERTWLGERFMAPPGIDAHDCVRAPAIALGTALLFLQHLRTRLVDLAVEPKRGRDQSPEKHLVGSLANIYEEFTGQRPTRRVEAGDLKAANARNEYGPFFELVTLLAAHVYAGLKEERIEKPKTLSFARVIKEEIESRKNFAEC